MFTIPRLVAIPAFFTPSLCALNLLPSESYDGTWLSEVDGNPIVRSVLTHAFARIARQVKLEDVHFQALCHTRASLMLLKGANPLAISQSLGHTSVAFTLQTYCHIMDSMKQDAARLFDNIMPSAVPEKINNKLTTIDYIKVSTR